MKVKLHKIENMVSRPARWFNVDAVRHDFDVSFSSSVVAGDAFLRIYEPLGRRLYQQVALDADLDVELSVEGETEVSDLESTDAPSELIRPLGLRGNFEMVAHLVKHLNSQDTLFSACGFPFNLRASNFPQDTLEIARGNLVRIRTQKLTFQTVAIVDKNQYKGENGDTAIKPAIDTQKDDPGGASHRVAASRDGIIGRYRLPIAPQP